MALLHCCKFGIQDLCLRSLTQYCSFEGLKSSFIHVYMGECCTVRVSLCMCNTKFVLKTQ